MAETKEFWKLAEAQVGKPLTDEEATQLWKLLHSPLFVRACAGLLEKVTEATRRLVMVDLTTPEGLQHAQATQAEVKAAYAVINDLLTQAKEDKPQ